MVGRRRGRTGRGWDAAPPRPRRTADSTGRATAAAGDPGSHPTASDPPGAAWPAGRRAGAARDREDPVGRAGVDPVDRAREDPAERARAICLRLLAVRPRTRGELETALRRHGIPDEVATEVLDRYGEVGMVDDAAFARAWVSSRHHGRGLARRALAGELRRRGVADEAVGEALAQVDADTEAETARTLVRRRLRTAGGPPEAMVRRLVGMLARKGYPPGLAFRVVKEVLAEDERTAHVADQLDPDALAGDADLD